VTKKQFYPAFLREFTGKSFDLAALTEEFHRARIAGQVQGEADVRDFFSEFKIDAAHWEYHQRILGNEELFRLLSEGYLHPTIHPVAAIYYDQPFYEFVFPFIHDAVMKRMAEMIGKGDLPSVKLLVQWIEPFGNLFHVPFYRMVQHFAETILREMEVVQLNRQTLSFDLYSRVSPAMMHLLNRLPQEYSGFREHFAQWLLQFAVWLRNEQKVYTQPEGIVTRLKLLSVSPHMSMQIETQAKQWETAKEQVGKSKFSLNHLIWIIPLMAIIAFVFWRNTEMGKSTEARQEEHAIELEVERQEIAARKEKVRLRMENIAMSELIFEELSRAHQDDPAGRSPVPPGDKDFQMSKGDQPYKAWLNIGWEPYPATEESVVINNESACTIIVFLKQETTPFGERGFYIPAGAYFTVNDDRKRTYVMRVYAGIDWSDSLVATGYDQTLIQSGVPEEAKDAFPSSTELHGRFVYPCANNEESMQPLYTGTGRKYETPDGIPIVTVKGGMDGITIE
jgi:hypothetical protein